MNRTLARWLLPVAFIAGYVALDRLSYIQPMFGLNITPWGPSPALGLVFWLCKGRRVAPYWFAALFLSELVTRRLPEGWLLTAGLSAWLVLGYGAIGEALRRYFPDQEIFDNRRDLLVWLSIVFVGTLVNSLGYLALLQLTDHIPDGEWLRAFSSFWVGDLVGVGVSMPLFWILSSARGRDRMRDLLHWETAGYVLLALLMLWAVFEPAELAYSNHFYFLFLPVVWAAARHGLAGSILVASVLQTGVIAGAEWGHSDVHSIVEFQLLDTALALVGFFLGTVINEQRQAANDLKRSLRLAAAGDMAAALAHELNQPITALLAYGKTCEYLMQNAGADALLRDTIQRMVNESTRAADVVRRLRDFFRTGTLRLENSDLARLVEEAAEPFRERLNAGNVTLVCDVPPGVTAWLDRIQFGLALRNLLANALDAVTTPPVESPTIRLTLSILAGKHLRISVEDNGPGVSPAIAAHLFEPFVSSKSSGLGLGLVITRSIVEAHGGKLWAEIGHHGVFRMELPLTERIDHANV